LERLQALKVKDKKKDTITSHEPQPLEIIPPEPTIKPKSNAQRMKEKLRLPQVVISHLDNGICFIIIHVISFIA